MPKGALLHAHLDATVNTSILLKLAIAQPAMHVRASAVLTSLTLKTVLPEFRPFPQAEWSTDDALSLTDEKYVPGTWISIQTARKNFATQLGGAEGFDQWVIAALTVNPAEAYGTHNTVKKVPLLLLW